MDVWDFTRRRTVAFHYIASIVIMSEWQHFVSMLY